MADLIAKHVKYQIHNIHEQPCHVYVVHIHEASHNIQTYDWKNKFSFSAVVSGLLLLRWVSQQGFLKNSVKFFYIGPETHRVSGLCRIKAHRFSRLWTIKFGSLLDLCTGRLLSNAQEYNVPRFDFIVDRPSPSHLFFVSFSK